jgi:competence protein CoiA
MKFAMVNGQRQEAQPNLSGKCQTCDSPVMAKCGEVRIWHWAHLGGRLCDPWSERETEWHRAWKDRFPGNWQEIIQRADNGEKHIADVMTDQGWVLEFQHSPITPEERRSRDAFYRKLVWVVDGTRLKQDLARFDNALSGGARVGSSVVRIPFSNECRILREWVGSAAPVFLDFGGDWDLWWILKGMPDGPAYLAPFPRSQFIEIHRSGSTQKVHDIFDGFVKDLSKLAADFESHLRAEALQPISMRPLQDPLQYLARRRARRRF